VVGKVSISHLQEGPLLSFEISPHLTLSKTLLISITKNLKLTKHKKLKST